MGKPALSTTAEFERLGVVADAVVRSLAITPDAYPGGEGPRVRARARESRPTLDSVRPPRANRRQRPLELEGVGSEDSQQ